MTAAPIPALAHDHDSPRGRGGMFPPTPPSSAAAKTVFRRSVAWASSSIRPRRSPRTCPTTPTTPADFRAPPNARPSNPHRPRPLAVAISAARGFLPRRLSDAGPSAFASASAPGRRPKPLTKPVRLIGFDPRVRGPTLARFREGCCGIRRVRGANNVLRGRSIHEPVDIALHEAAQATGRWSPLPISPATRRSVSSPWSLDPAVTARVPPKRPARGVNTIHDSHSAVVARRRDDERMVSLIVMIFKLNYQSIGSDGVEIFQSPLESENLNWYLRVLKKAGR
jgi:hypothetical protein